MFSAQSAGFSTPKFSNLTPYDVSRSADIATWALRAGDEYMGVWFRQMAGKLVRKLIRR